VGRLELKGVCKERMKWSWFDDNIVWRVDMIKTLKFWENKWCGEALLIKIFLRFFGNSISQRNLNEVGI